MKSSEPTSEFILPNNLEHFFKPEARKSGADLVEKGQVKIRYQSDTQFQSYIKSFKIALSLPNIASPTLMATCSCSLFTKGTLCKHIWATIVLAEEKNPELLEARVSIERSASATRSETFQKLAATKQKQYRKEQYQKQKLWAKEKQKSLKSKTKKMPQQAVKDALLFFSQNGFDLENRMDEELLKSAKKKLARVFHPDAGGSHDESVALNKSFDVLMRYLGS